MRRHIILCLIIIALGQLATTARAIESKPTFAVPSASEMRQRAERLLGRPLEPGESIQLESADVGIKGTQFSMGPEEKALQAPGCSMYYYVFSNGGNAPCNLFVESATLTDPAYPLIIDNPTFNVSIAPGATAYGTFPVQQCATHLHIRYHFTCGAGCQVDHEMDANWGPYGFVWLFHHIESSNPSVSTAYLRGPRPDFCTVPFVNGTCAAPFVSLKEYVSGRGGPLPTLTSWGLIALFGILLVLAVRHLRGKARTAA